VVFRESLGAFFEDLKRFCKVDDPIDGRENSKPAPATELSKPEKDPHSASPQLTRIPAGGSTDKPMSIEAGVILSSHRDFGSPRWAGDQSKHPQGTESRQGAKVRGGLSFEPAP
jgi:hypothetical protein